MRARTLVSRAMCNINPASVSSLSRTGCPRTKGAMIYIFGPVFSPRIYRINVPVRFHVSCWHWRPIFVLSKQRSVSDGRYIYVCAGENTGSLAIFLLCPRWNLSHPLAFVMRVNIMIVTVTISILSLDIISQYKLMVKLWRSNNKRCTPTIGRYRYNARLLMY